MLSFRAMLLAVVSALLMAGLVSSQSATCPSAAGCNSFSMTTPSGTVTLALTYDSNGDVCTLTGTVFDYSVTPVQIGDIDSKSTAAGSRPNKVVVQMTNVNGVVQEAVVSVDVSFSGTNTITGVAGLIGSVTGPVAAGGAVITFPTVFTSPATASAAMSDFCTGSGTGDPLFKGFLGQQFYVGGEDGQVMNMLSTFNMQVNGRFVTLEEGSSIKPDEQDKLRKLSEIAHQSEPSVAAFPKTTAWTHPGNYFGEVGVALLDDNRVYTKAGPYATGFAKVALNGRQLSVSDEMVVLGQGLNTTYIQRVSAHELMIRTVNVEVTVVNSDHFVNVDRVHLEKGFRQHSRFGGMLGHTTNSKWTWNKKDEEEAVVQSNDLFAKEA